MYTDRELSVFKLVVSISSLLNYDWELTRRIALETAELGKQPEDVTLEELASLVRRERVLFERSHTGAELFDQRGTESESNPTPSPPAQHTE